MLVTNMTERQKFNLEQIWDWEFWKVVTNTENRVRHLTNWAIWEVIQHFTQNLYHIQQPDYVLQTDKLHLTIICQTQSILRYLGQVKFLLLNYINLIMEGHRTCYRQTEWLTLHCPLEIEKLKAFFPGPMLALSF